MYSISWDVEVKKSRILHWILSLVSCVYSLGFANVYLVRKNGGSDDGQLYALKVINIRHALTLEGIYKSKSLNIEREVRFEIQFFIAWHLCTDNILSEHFPVIGNG